MNENLQNVVNAAVKLSPGERLELIEAVSRSLQLTWLQLEGLNGEQALTIPNYVRRTSPVTSLKRLEVDFWPDDETADDINDFIRRQRQEDLALEK
ncbi:MAG TPA: hypothetical protein VFY40_03830 [Blastocatellia bacterium]|nr:hypothetical protein [Blastocatellia bacterium]